jgi:hypothetical protein
MVGGARQSSAPISLTRPEANFQLAVDLRTMCRREAVVQPAGACSASCQRSGPSDKVGDLQDDLCRLM